MNTREEALPSNGLLASLDPGEWAALQGHFERVKVARRAELLRPDDQHEYLWFPEGGVFSLVLPTVDGTCVEILITGNEGILGLPACFGVNRAVTRTIAQFDTTALRIPLAAFTRAVPPGHPLFANIQRFAGVTLIALAQLSACNRLHSSEQRLCRWLLSVRDRLHTNDLEITHEFLALMLGTRRPSITAVAGAMQKRGILRYHRSAITILDERHLLSSACECYGAIRKSYEAAGITSPPPRSQ